MNNKQGVSVRQRLSGKIDYRASLTYKGKHIALGSYDSKIAAHNAYEYGKKILKSKSVRLKNIPEAPPLYYEKCVSLINVRDNGLYIANPIYLKKNFSCTAYLRPFIIDSILKIFFIFLLTK